MATSPFEIGYVGPLQVPQLFANYVSGVFLVFAHVLDYFGVGEKFKLHRERPGLGVGLGIVNGDFDVQVTKVAAAKAFNRMKSLGMRKAVVIEPAFVIETARINHEPIPFPPTDGIAEPGWIGRRGMGAAVCENLTETREFFIQN